MFGLNAVFSVERSKNAVCTRCNRVFRSCNCVAMVGDVLLEFAGCMQGVDFEFAGDVQTPLSSVFSFMSSQTP